MHLGPNRILIVLGVNFAPDLRAPEVEDAVMRVQRRVSESLGGVTDDRLVVIEAAPADGRHIGAYPVLHGNRLKERFTG